MKEKLPEKTKRRRDVTKPQYIPPDDERAVLAALLSTNAPTTPEEIAQAEEKKGHLEAARILRNVLARRKPGPENPQKDLDFGSGKGEVKKNKTRRTSRGKEPSADRKVGPRGDTQKRQKDLDFGS